MLSMVVERFLQLRNPGVAHVPAARHRKTKKSQVHFWWPLGDVVQI